MDNFRDLRGLVKLLEKHQKLFRFTKAINKETELVPFFRLQLRGLDESERKVFLFENVVGAKGKKYDMSVLVGVYGGSEDILSIGMRSRGYLEMLEKWHDALTHPIAPVLVKTAGLMVVALILRACPPTSRVVDRGLLIATLFYGVVVSWNVINLGLL